MKEIKDIAGLVSNSPTKSALLKAYPKGSSPTAKEVEDFYVRESKSPMRHFRAHSQRHKGQRTSNFQTKKQSARMFRRLLIRIGFWNN